MITCKFESGALAHLRHVVVHAMAEKNGKLLLVKRATSLSLEGGKWSLPGGFLDRDETAEQCALRELKEETGWEGEVGRLLCIKTNPNRPHEDRQNVSFSFVVKPTKQTGSHDHETSAISWVSIDDLPPPEMLAFDHGEMIGYYLKHRASPLTPPILL